MQLILEINQEKNMTTRGYFGSKGAIDDFEWLLYGHQIWSASLDWAFMRQF